MKAREKRFETLVQGHSAALYRYAYWLCNGDVATAEDLVQDTFLRAWKSLDQLLEAGASKAWLMTILRRESARRFERKQFDFADIDPGQVAADPGVLERELDSHDLRHAIAQLPPTYRDPLLLQAIGGFSCQEIGQILDLGKGAVMTRLFRAKKMLTDAIDNAATQRSMNNE